VAGRLRCERNTKGAENRALDMTLFELIRTYKIILPDSNLYQRFRFPGKQLIGEWIVADVTVADDAGFVDHK
jgi:hypothetical protein